MCRLIIPARSPFQLIDPFAYRMFSTRHSEISGGIMQRNASLIPNYISLEHYYNREGVGYLKIC